MKWTLEQKIVMFNTYGDVAFASVRNVDLFERKLKGKGTASTLI